jgi:hypothetical protein
VDLGRKIDSRPLSLSAQCMPFSRKNSR